MLDLDRKVARDSIFVADMGGQLDGFFSKIVKKYKKIRNKLPGGKLYRKIPGHKIVKKLEKKYRPVLKKIGAVAAVAVAIYFGGPAVMKFVGSMGGKGLASKAGSKLLQAAVTSTIKKKMTKSQEKKMRAAMAKLTPAQLMADPEIAQLSREIAAAEAALKLKGASPAKKYAGEVLATEGAFEIEHQIKKVATKAPPRMPILAPENLAKIAIPAGIALLALLI